VNALPRRAASPYARRLARERGLVLERIAGSGPRGRIVAADIEAATRAPVVTPVAAAAPVIAAFAITVDLSKLQALLRKFGGAQLALTLDDMLVRAAGLGLEAVASTRPDAPSIVVALETAAATGEIVIVAPQIGLISALHRRLAEAPGDAVAPAAEPGALSLRRLTIAGLRPTLLPLRRGYPMRLAVAAADDDETADCLLAFDTSKVGEIDAAAFLGQFRDALETPLRLLA
jgi:pyruvate dehydrogenase E2 component (dihydrolipoamide acetyltransferase)